MEKEDKMIYTQKQMESMKAFSIKAMQALIPSVSKEVATTFESVASSAFSYGEAMLLEGIKMEEANQKRLDDEFLLLNENQDDPLDFLLKPFNDGVIGFKKDSLKNDIEKHLEKIRKRKEFLLKKNVEDNKL